MSVVDIAKTQSNNNAVMLEKLPKVYDAGKQAEYNDFWDSILLQSDGQPQTDYQFSFGGLSWNDKTFKPNHDIVPINARNMFINTRISNLKKNLEDCKVTLNTSLCKKCERMFYLSCVVEAPELDLAEAEHLNSICYQSRLLKSISFKISGSGEQTFVNSFVEANALTNITFEGVIGQDIDFSYSPLSVESMKSVISHLNEYLGKNDEWLHTVTFRDDCWEALNNDSNSPPPLSEEDKTKGLTTWQDYVYYKLGWQY